MGKPQAVQRQIDEAERIQKEISEGKTEDQSTELKTVEKSDPVPAKTDQVSPGNDSIETLKAQLDQLNSRYKAYKKMYDKEVTGTRKKIDALEQENTGLKEEIQTLKADTSKKQEDSDSDQMLDQISNEFGPEFVEAVSNLSKGQLMRENALLMSRIEKVEKKLTGTTDEQLTGNESVNEPGNEGYGFFDRLTDLVADWQEINESQQFKDWLNGIDKNGNRRQDNLSAAQQTGQAQIVAELFYSFKDSQMYSHRKSAGEQIMPDSSGSGEQTGSAVIITQQYISDFYRDKALGHFTPEEAAKREAKINAAMEAGTIR